MKPFYVYVLRCSDGSYYTGHTDELETRLAKHQSGLFGGYTARRRPVHLVYACPFTTRLEALSTEFRIKGWSRAKKETLFKDDWARIHELARCRTRPSTRPPDGGGLARGERGNRGPLALSESPPSVWRGRVEAQRGKDA